MSVIDSCYLFSVGKGNFPNQIVKVMEQRGNWRLIEEDAAVEQADFYWRPTNFGAEGYHRINN